MTRTSHEPRSDARGRNVAEKFTDVGVSIATERAAFAVALADLRARPSYERAELFESFIESRDPHVAFVVARVVLALCRHDIDGAIAGLDDADGFLAATDDRKGARRPS